MDAVKGVKRRFAVRLRAFRIWQELGFMPWSKKKTRSRKKDFYKGAFDTIPFMNDDAKRTFAHLLLRPGYMIRDYIRGQHERYLAPLTSLIIFYAFFALVSSIVNPDLPRYSRTERPVQESYRDSVMSKASTTSADSLILSFDRKVVVNKVLRAAELIKLLDLDRHPERVDTPAKASLAALENELRSQGVYLFLGQFLLLWGAMCFALKKRKMKASACAAAAAYVLCQFCFFMFFSLFLSSDNKGEIGVGLMAILLTADYRQMFGIGWKKGFRQALKTGVYYILMLVIMIIVILAAIWLFTSIEPKV